ncbi:MAG: four helix bundle protein [Isosphaeraceae bacterium]
MASRDDQDLIAWQKAMDLVMAVYAATGGFPREENDGLRAQVRKAVVSVPSNIAEGEGRRTTREFLRFLSIAHGPLREVETRVLIAERLGHINRDCRCEVLEAASEVGRLITGLSNRLLDRLGP